MSKTKIELSSSGITAFLQSGEVAKLVEREAARLASMAGPGYASSGKNTPGRKIAALWPETREAKSDNLKNNTLEKVIRRK